MSVEPGYAKFCIRTSENSVLAKFAEWGFSEGWGVKKPQPSRAGLNVAVEGAQRLLASAGLHHPRGSFGGHSVKRATPRPIGILLPTLINEPMFSVLVVEPPAHSAQYVVQPILCPAAFLRVGHAGEFRSSNPIRRMLLGMVREVVEYYPQCLPTCHSWGCCDCRPGNG
jgi:hypothetical protein